MRTTTAHSWPSTLDPGANMSLDPSRTRPIKVLVVDDQSLVRAGFRVILEGEADLEVVGEAGDGMEALRQNRELGPTWCSWTSACRQWTASKRPGG